MFRMIDFKRFSVAGANCNLSVVDFGSAHKPDMVVLHGTHDHALGMYPAIAGLIEHYHIIGLDLRGHGRSDKPGNYSVFAMVGDLRAVIIELGLEKPALVVHSLGGHIGCRYAAIYPDEVSALAVLDGMGAPRPPREIGAKDIADKLRHGVQGALRKGQRSRRMADQDEALARFRRSNPHLDEDSVHLIVENGLELHPEGGLRWCFDPTIDLIFHTYADREAECMVSLVTCPVLLVTGDRALDFWHGVGLGLEVDAGWYAKEQLRRENLFKRARWVEIADAGHMLHYDQPEAVQRVLEEFLNSERSRGQTP
jgi:pimeloyl-ACP methyl ester carboxylesterase